MDPIVKSIPLSQIVPSPHQARKTFDIENLKGLAESMKQEGLLNPVVVRKIGTGYELISGERRLRAAKLLGWPSLEAKVIGTVSEAEAAAKGLIENIQREDLNTIEEAEGYRELNRLDPKYWTQSKIAQNCGKTQGHVSEFLRYLSLPEVVKGYIRRRILSAGHAAELIRLHKPLEQKALAQKILRNKLSVMQTRDAIDRKQGKKPPLRSETPVVKPQDPLSDVWSTLQNNPATAPEGHWDVAYGTLGNPRLPSLRGWTFSLADTGDVEKGDLSRWFREMADALEGPRNAARNSSPINPVQTVQREEISSTEPVQENQEEPEALQAEAIEQEAISEPLEEKPTEVAPPEQAPIPAAPPVRLHAPISSPRVSMMHPSSQNEFEIMAQERANLRLPKNRQEEIELEILSSRGLFPVYQWIYGTDSLTARKVYGRTWAEWGVADPIAGVRGIITALRKIQGTAKL